MQTKFYKPQPIPKTSKEAFALLSDPHNNDVENMGRIIFNFKQLVSKDESVLTSHALSNSRINDNQKFIDDLDSRFARLQKAIIEKRLYPTLFGDVCKIKEDLQVISAYYQSQLKKGQPIVQTYLRQAQHKSSPLTALASDVSHGKHPIHDKKDTDLLTKYIVNYCANHNMQGAIKQISEIVQKPYLFDHSDDPKFSYLQ
ncbi:hypothetical protein [Fluoribacter dumoffii]|uniref:Uncharacterized protein n=1 Tax=Fluoribacter dumoffii TaxID=463 RepID=A0A377GBJ7_9GAMM|nr:hypothetical protein [Fluoribacter dumoffii]KTC90504.1 hypothetical protein Ldum_1572 [Fluoribacter dumoffii NY 23]STO22183.1 Uncharacterised protein [Fluoribacter dumoffii]